MNRYFVNIQGCEDHTSFQIDLSTEELRGVLKIVEESQKASTYYCMPFIKLYPEQDLSKVDEQYGISFDNDYERARAILILPKPLKLEDYQ